MIPKVIPKVFGVEVQSIKNPNHCLLRGYLHKHFLEQNILGDGGWVDRPLYAMWRLLHRM